MMMNTKKMKTKKIKSQAPDVMMRQMDTTCRLTWIIISAHGHGKTGRPRSK